MAGTAKASKIRKKRLVQGFPTRSPGSKEVRVTKGQPKAKAGVERKNRRHPTRPHDARPASGTAADSKKRLKRLKQSATKKR